MGIFMPVNDGMNRVLFHRTAHLKQPQLIARYKIVSNSY